MRGQAGCRKVRALLNCRSSLDRWRARRMKPAAKAQEDRQSLIDGSHLFLSKLAKYFGAHQKLPANTRLELPLLGTGLRTRRGRIIIRAAGAIGWWS